MKWLLLLAVASCVGLGIRWWITREAWPVSEAPKYWMDDDPSLLQQLRALKQKHEADREA